MTVQTLLSFDVAPLGPTDTVGHALYRLADLDVQHLPVLDADGQLMNVIGGDDLLDDPSPEAFAATVRGLGPVFVGPDAHWYQAASLLAQHHLSILPVVDREGHYLGLVRRSDLFDRFAGSLSTGSLGAVLIIEVPQRDFSMSQLCHLIEQSDARVLSVSTQGQEQAPTTAPLPIHVTLKLNTADTSRVKHVLEHHGYHVVAAFNEEITDEAFNYRLAEFLRYLEA
jgi:acetoin utilization protein AcuB